MKFLSLELEDIFAYRGPSRVDLGECTGERNIVTIQGRNGHGKTSLLNAVKLLFLGVEDERIRRVGIGSTPLGPKQFVVGQTGRWYGVFNTIARASDAPARVAMNWLDQEGRECRAERIYWPLRGGTDYREQLNVTVDRQQLEPGPAQAFLQSLLPKEVVPFFFFDGEQIQSLADAEIGREQAEIERLLGLSFVAHITREIDNYGRERRKAGLPETAQMRITQAEGALKTAQAAVDAAHRSRVTLEEEIQDLDRERKRIDAERSRLRGGLSEEDRRRMVARIAMLSGQREALAERIAREVPIEIPALANLSLVRQAFAMLEEQLSGAADATLAARLHKKIPEALLSALESLAPPVQLTEHQQARVRAMVAQALTEAGVASEGSENPLFASLSPRKLKALRDRFLLWTQAGERNAAAQAALLRQARQLAHDEQQLRQELDEAEITSEEARQKYAALTTQYDGFESSIREKVAEAREHELAEQRAQRDVAQQEDQIGRLYAEQDHITRQNRAFQLARKVKRALEDYRDERRKLIRASVEARLNQRVQVLLGPTQLIKEVRLDPHFGLTYLDEMGEQVGRHSLSAGMRQLAAMAMLWALKDEARRPLPVIIDTPLGRIDRENRALLMRDYFPNAGNPLILLPTNTELSEDDYATLDVHIAKRYEIMNEGGTSARIVEVARPAVEGAARHG